MMYRIFFNRILPLLFFVAIATGVTAQDAELVAKGKALFKENTCNTCHSSKMTTDLTGPALAGVQQRWEDAGQGELIYDWVRNSQGLVSAGNPYAKSLFSEWGTVMQNFPKLTNEDIDAILAYVEYQVANPAVSIVAKTDGGGTAQDSGINPLYLVLLFAVLAMLALILSRIVGNLNRMAQQKAGLEPDAPKSLYDVMTSRTVITFLVFAIVILGGYTTLNNATALGRQQNYAPQQPINFSHELHAGINDIDCQYCHDGARRSKHAMIPSTNACMNCHKAINGKDHGSEIKNAESRTEIAKIYASARYNPAGTKYFDADVSDEDIAKGLKEWFTAQYKGDSPSDIKATVEEQMEAITPFINRPIEWVKVHNLPDHVYFNHAQHVAVGGVECQTCHGNVEEMPVVRQYAPLSMGWCINCHRQTEVSAFTDNEYYKAYNDYKHAVETGNMDKVTVEDIGGLECQKCHY